MKSVIAAIFLFIAALAAGADKDVRVPQFNGTTGAWPNVTISPASNSLMGFSSDKTVGAVTIGSGLSLSGGSLTATAGTGTVTSVSVTTANGVSGIVANATTTPAITLTLGAISPTSVSTGALTSSALTATRVPFAGVAGLLADDSDFTFATDTLTATKGTFGGVTHISNAIASANSITSAPGQPLVLATGSYGTAATISSASGTFALSGDRAGPFMTCVNGTGVANRPNYLEFADSRAGSTVKVSFGALGGLEANLGYNMDYADGVHRFYDSTKNAVWGGFNGTQGWFVQWAPLGATPDIWTNTGSQYIATAYPTADATFANGLSVGAAIIKDKDNNPIGGNGNLLVGTATDPRYKVYILGIDNNGSILAESAFGSIIAGKRTTATSSQGFTMLSIPAFNGSTEVARVWLQSGGDTDSGQITLRTKNHSTAIADALVLNKDQTFSFTAGGSVAGSLTLTGSNFSTIGDGSGSATWIHNRSGTGSNAQTAYQTAGVTKWVAGLNSTGTLDGTGTAWGVHNSALGLSAFYIASATNAATLTGNLSLGTAGTTMSVKSGSNAMAGTVTLTAGSGTITSTAIDANTVIVLTLKTASGANSHPQVSVAAGSATVTGLGTDAGTYNWVGLKVN